MKEQMGRHARTSQMCPIQRGCAGHLMKFAIPQLSFKDIFHVIVPIIVFFLPFSEPEPHERQVGTFLQ